jgi:hypothetical protein
VSISILEFFWPNHCHEQINKEQQRDKSDDGGFHLLLLQPLAKARVERGDDEEHNDNADKNEVVHKNQPNDDQNPTGSVN